MDCDLLSLADVNMYQMARPSFKSCNSCSQKMKSVITECLSDNGPFEYSRIASFISAVICSWCKYTCGIDASTDLLPSFQEMISKRQAQKATPCEPL